MPRYELVEGSSSKFWEVALAGAALTVRFGRIGTKGQEQTKRFGSSGEAKKAYDKLIAEKTKKGYRAVDGAATRAPAAAHAAATKSRPSSASSSFVALIPEDRTREPESPVPEGALGEALATGRRTKT